MVQRVRRATWVATAAEDGDVMEVYLDVLLVLKIVSQISVPCGRYFRVHVYVQP